jgi:type IV fimbrial biogenesis protein FimT
MNKRAFRHRSPRDKGFTLVELLVTLTILTILMLIGVPAMQGFLQSRQATAQADTVASSLKFARSEAIKHGQRVVMCRTTSADSVTPACDNTSADWASGWLVFVDANNDGAFSTNELLLQVQQAFTSKGRVDGHNRTQKIVVFTPDGLAISDNGSFIVVPDANTNDNKRCVVLSPQGRIRLAKVSQDRQGQDKCAS